MKVASTSPLLLATVPVGVVRDTFLNSAVCAKLAEFTRLTWNESDKQLSPNELAARLPGVEILVTGWGSVAMTAEVLQKADSLKLLCHTGGSVGMIVSEALFDRGVAVISANRQYAEGVAEGVLAYILAALRRLVTFANEAQAGIWRTEDFYNETLYDKKIGLIGFGAVAQYLVGLLKPFRVKVVASDPFVPDETFRKYGVERVETPEILSECDIVSLHAAAVPENRHMINEKSLATIRTGALLVNTARGMLIDEAALARELAKGRFIAVLDVYETEPLPVDSPLIGLPNVMLQPHLAGPSMEGRRNVMFPLIEDIKRFYRGEAMENQIQPQVAFRMTR